MAQPAELFWPAFATKLPPVGFGCFPMGRHGWGAVAEEDLLQAVEAALARGIRFFDTADVYGLGTSEEILGRALRGRRERAIIATKFGVRVEGGRTFYDTSPAWIRQAVENSLRRLGTDYIDLYQMHYWDHQTPLAETVAVLESLITKGKIRAYGVTNQDPLDPALQGRGSPVPVSYSYQYSLVDRAREAHVLAAQAATSLVFLSWGSLGQGILSGKYRDLDALEATDRRRRAVYANFHGTRFEAIQRLLVQLEVVRQTVGGGSLAQVALRWIIDRIPRAIPLVGIKRPEQIIDAAGALEFKLEAGILDELDRLTASFCAASPAP